MLEVIKRTIDIIEEVLKYTKDDGRPVSARSVENIDCAIRRMSANYSPTDMRYVADLFLHIADRLDISATPYRVVQFHYDNTDVIAVYTVGKGRTQIATLYIDGIIVDPKHATRYEHQKMLELWLINETASRYVTEQDALDYITRVMRHGADKARCEVCIELDQYRSV